MSALSELYTVPQEHLDFRDTIREIARERIAPRAAEIDEQAAYPHDLRRLLAEQDILGLPFESEHGGTGTGTLMLNIAVEEIAKAYDGQALFHGLTFEVGREERLAIVGVNGSGKSTLLRVLTGEEAPDAGQVTWEGGVSFADFNRVERELDAKDTVTHAVNVFGLGFGATREQVHRFL